MDAPIQADIPGLPEEHVSPRPSCELCGKELPPERPGKTGRKQRWCTQPLGGGRTSCHALATAAQRVAAELPPSRGGEIRRLKRKAAHRKERGLSLSAEDQGRLDALLAEVGEEYPEAVRHGFRSLMLGLLNRLNSNGWGAA